jgi:hypothetical protein
VKQEAKPLANMPPKYAEITIPQTDTVTPCCSAKSLSYTCAMMSSRQQQITRLGKVARMTMYQVMDEENHCIATFHHFQEAIYTAQDFTLWDDEHYYHVEELDMAVA